MKSSQQTFNNNKWMNEAIEFKVVVDKQQQTWSERERERAGYFYFIVFYSTTN